MIKSKSAGGIVVNNNNVLVVSQKGTSWSLPKGHIENGEDEVSAAIREIYEESGVKNLKLVKKLGKYRRFKISKKGGDDKSELKEITMFLFKTDAIDSRPIDLENPEIKWVEKEEVVNLLTHPKDKQFFLEIKDQISFAAGKEPTIINGGKSYSIKKDNLEYRDTYFDQHQYFQGQEILFENELPIWSMSYRGAAIEGFAANEIFSVLQKFIKEYADKTRFGENFQRVNGEYKYIVTANGDTEEFSGREEIYKNNQLAHWMEYFGGKIK